MVAPMVFAGSNKPDDGNTKSHFEFLSDLALPFISFGFSFGAFSSTSLTVFSVILDTVFNGFSIILGNETDGILILTDGIFTSGTGNARTLDTIHPIIHLHRRYAGNFNVKITNNPNIIHNGTRKYQSDSLPH